MTEGKYSSPAIAKSMKDAYGDRARPAQIEMKYEKEARKFVVRLQRLYNRPSNGKLVYK